MLKHEFNNFLDSLKSEGKLLAVSHIYEQKMARPGLDFYYLRSKLEDIVREGLGQNPLPYLDLISIPTVYDDLPEWGVNSLHLVLEKCLDLSRENDMMKVLKKCMDKLSTIKVVDLLKKIMILNKNELGLELLESALGNKNHSKSI